MSSNNASSSGMKRSDSVQQLRDMANTFTNKIAGFFHLSTNSSSPKDRQQGSANEFVSTNPMGDDVFRARIGSSGSSDGERTPTKKSSSSKISSKIAKLRLPLMSGNNSNENNASGNKAKLSPTSPFAAPTPSYPCTSRLLSLQTTSSNRQAVMTPSGGVSINTFSSASSSSSSPENEQTAVVKGHHCRTLSEQEQGTATRKHHRHGRISCAIGKAVAKIQQRHHGNKEQSGAAAECETDVGVAFNAVRCFCEDKQGHLNHQLVAGCNDPHHLLFVCSSCQQQQQQSGGGGGLTNKQIFEQQLTNNCCYCHRQRLTARLFGLDVLRRCWPAMERTVVTYDIELTGVPASLSSALYGGNNKQNQQPLPCLPGIPAYNKSAAQTLLYSSLLAYVKSPDTLPDDLRVILNSSQQNSHFKGDSLLEWLCSTIDRTHYLQYLVKNDLITLALQFCTDLLALGVIRPAMTTATASPTTHGGDANCLGVFKPEMNYTWSTFLTNTARSFNGSNGFHSPAETESPTGSKNGTRFTQQDVEAIIQKLKSEFADRLELSEKDHSTKTARLRNRYEAEMRMLELKMSEMSVRIAQLEAENGKLTGRCKQLEIEQSELQQKQQQQKKDENVAQAAPPHLPDVVNPASSTSSGLDTTSTSSLVINLVSASNNRSVSPETSSISSMVSSSGSHSPQPTQPGLMIIGGDHQPGNVSPVSCELQSESSATPVLTPAGTDIATPLPTTPRTEQPQPQQTPPPPPSSGTGGPPPPPPPPPSAAIKKVPRKKVVKVSTEMKPLFWRRIQFMAAQPAKPSEASTLWFTLQEPFIDVKEVEKHFGRSSGRPTSPAMRLSDALSQASSTRGQDGRSKKLLDGRRSQAIGIAISSYRLTFDQIREVLVNGRLTAVKLSLLETLDKHRPTAEEVDSLVEYVREFGEEGLDKPDLICYRLTRIPRYDLRLNSLIVRLTLPDGLQSFEAKLSAFRQTCDRVRSSDQLRFLFGVVLAVGNVLNAGNTSRGQADGFQLDVVPKLKEIKSSDGSLTVLHFVVNEFITHLLKTVAGGNMDRLSPDPELPTQPELAAAADVDLTSLRVDLDRLKSDLERCSRNLDLIQQGDQQQQQMQQPQQQQNESTSLSVSPANNMMPTPPGSDGDASSQGDASPPSASPQPPPVQQQPQPTPPKLLEDGFTVMLKNFIVQAQEDITQTEQLMKDSESKFASLVGYFALSGIGHDSPQQSTSASSTSGSSGNTAPSGPSPADLFAPLAAFSSDITAVYRREVARRRRLAVVAERRSQSVIYNSPQPSNPQTHPFFQQQNNHANSAPRPASSSVKDRLLRQGRLV